MLQECLMLRTVQKDDDVLKLGISHRSARSAAKMPFFQSVSAVVGKLNSWKIHNRTNRRG